VDWITALKAPTIKKLARSGVFQPSLFDEQNLGEITDVAEFPGERLSCAATRWSARSAPENAQSCSRQPRLISLRSLTVSPPGR